MSKAEIRRSVFEKRNAASAPWRAMASRDIARRALAHVASGPGGAVAGYWPIQSEADPRPLLWALRDHGRALALPVIHKPDLLFRRLVEGVDLVDAGFGTLGPDPSAEVLRPAILLVPMAAFDADCHRIGWGKGYYDRMISTLKQDGGMLMTVGIAFSFQQVDKVPAESHDHPLDLVVTEQAVFRKPLG